MIFRVWTQSGIARRKFKREEEKTRKNMCVSSKTKAGLADSSDPGSRFHFQFRAAARRCRKSAVVYTFIVPENIKHRERSREFRSDYHFVFIDTKAESNFTEEI